MPVFVLMTTQKESTLFLNSENSFSILQQNGVKIKVKFSLFNNF